MTILKMSFAGEAKKVEHRKAGDKDVCEVSLCRKHKGRNGADDTFTWIKVTIWQPADFQVAKLIKGAFVSGVGDVELRGYDANDGSRKYSLDVRCTSFDVEVQGEPAAKTEPTAKPTSAGASYASAVAAADEPPF